MAEFANTLTAALIIVSVLFVLLLAVFVIYVIRSKKRAGSLNELACSDTLTGISSYQKFCQNCEEARKAEPRASFAVIALDVNHFRMINNTFGYGFGDKALIYVADVIRKALGKDQFYCRQGADIFLIFMKTRKDDPALIKLIENISEQMDHVCIEGLTVNLKPSFGIYVIDSMNTDIRVCIDDANITRRMVKDDPQREYAYFDKALQGLATERSQTQADLENAIDRQELQIYYQPQLSVKTGEIVGMEALLRWKHPKKGFISPAYFIPIAEKTGLIYKFGRFAFEQVCKDLLDWKKRSKYMSVSFNLSRVELYQTNLIPFLEETMEKYQVDPDQIEIEIEEASTVEDLSFISNIIQQLKSIGLKVALSDFGTGYSSLNTLETLKFDVLKLNRSFLHNLTPLRMNTIETMVKLAKSLGFSVVAEYVETQEEVDFLTGIGCDIAQGFYYTKPMSKPALEAFVFGTPTHKKAVFTDIFTN